MKSLITLLFAVILLFQLSFAQSICNENGNVILFSNYDGGTLNINIDENVPNIQLGLCSYEPLTVNISGTYAGNITEVRWAGYTIDGTTVAGVDAGIVDLFQYPPVTISDPDGNSFMVCAYECDLDYVPGGCNTVDQATDYFLTNFGGTLRFSNFQYGVWNGTYNISDGGNCCVGVSCSITVTASEDDQVCQGDSIVLTATGGESFIWELDGTELECAPPCNSIMVSPFTESTYVVTGTNIEGCSGTDEVTVTVNDLPDAQLIFNDGTLYAYGGVMYAWYQDGEYISEGGIFSFVPDNNGTYQVLVTNTSGCSAWSNEVDVILDTVENLVTPLLSIYPNPADKQLCIELASGENLKYFIYNSSGVVVMQEDITLKGERAFIDTSSLPSGIYDFKFITPQIVTKRIVISR